MEDPGLDLHDWETRWQQLQEDAADDPVEALPEIVRLVEQMLRERSFELDEPVTGEGEEPEIVTQFLGARDLAAAAEQGAVDPEDVEDALDALREVHDYLVEDRPLP
jgi:hypothetical protein